VNVHELERDLLRIEQDPLISSVQAGLEPGESPGEAVLRIDLREATPWWALAAFNNFQSPAIGSERGELRLGHRNVTGFGDALEAGYTGSEGLQAVKGTWRVLLGPRRTELGLHYEGIWSEIVEREFEDLDISSTAHTAGIEVRQPLVESSEFNLSASLVGEFRETESFLLGDPFTLQAGADEGLVRLWVLRATQDLTWSASRGSRSWLRRRSGPRRGALLRRAISRPGPA